MKHFQVNYDIVPSNGVSTQAQAFNVSSLTGIWSLSGHTAFTSHFQILNFSRPVAEIVFAVVRFVGGSGVVNGAVVSGRFVSMHYDAGGNQVWEDVGPLLTQRPQYTVDNLAADVTTQLRSWSEGFQRNISLKVQGNGKLYEARLEIEYAIPDAVTGPDYSAAIADLQARVGTLETNGPVLTGPLSATQVEQVLDAAAERVAGA